MTEFVGAGHPLHLFAHIRINEDEVIVQVNLTESLLLFRVNELHIVPEKPCQLKRISGSMPLDQMLGYTKNSLVHS
jgi:hypothetical protein